MTAYVMTAPARPIPAQARPRQGRARVYAVQTPAARARRKAIARIALVALVLAALAIIAPRAIAGDEAGPVVAHDTYTVAQGESLWSIASALTAPGDQVRETMNELKTLNAMSSGSLQAGQQIAIPALNR